MGALLRIANVAMGLLFLMGAAVQWNDPDPLGWILIYSGAALACAVFRRVSWARWVASATAVAGIAWGARIGSEMPRWVAPSQMFEPMERYGGAVEMAREFWGLSIIVLWMNVLIWSGRGQEK